jgi:hypothetical protein
MVTPYVGIAAGCAFLVLLVRMRWYHLAVALLFAAGGLLSAFAAYMAGYFGLAAAGLGETRWVFMPALAGIIAWSFLFCRLFSRSRSSAQVPFP